VVHRTREHPSQLGGPDARLEGRSLRRDLGDRGFVVLRGSEVEQDDRVLEVARQLLDRADLLLDAGALARYDLRDLLVVPEARRERLLLELVDLRLELRQVKDAPLAP
jgi:hypothetical protein